MHARNAESDQITVAGLRRRFLASVIIVGAAMLGVLAVIGTLI